MSEICNPITTLIEGYRQSWIFCQTDEERQGLILLIGTDIAALKSLQLSLVHALSVGLTNSTDVVVK